MFQFAFAYNYAKRNHLDYYYQDPIFFEDSVDDIKVMFGQDIPTQTDMVAIHVRRGDYINNPFYIDLTETDYYEKAMAMFPNQSFVVFSDNIDWCKNQEVFRKCEFSHGTELEDMNNMASCVGHIIANSSFSWWAAYISPYTKKVVAPSVDNWYADGFERTICPNEWIRM